MNRPIFATAALSALMALSSVLPASAMPVTTHPTKSSSQIEQVQVVIKYGKWRGHRGYRVQRPGYRRHRDGFWYPRAAFTVRVAPGVRVRVGPAQARWCRDRYKTYRISDNTFVATGGVRRVCRVPF
jgi:hypothetical protein